MAKFLNKKEEVIDLKLTSYGHHLLAEGTFKPEYYGFYDNNIVYDGSYVNRIETQNEIHDRIKNQTQYLEGQVLFEEVEDAPNTLVEVTGPTDIDTDGDGIADSIDPGQRYFLVDTVPITHIPRKDVFRYESMIGDAHLEGNVQHAPAWKLATLKGAIDSISKWDTKNDILIPQVDIDANYYLKIVNNAMETTVKDTSFNAIDTQTRPFSDDRLIRLEQDNIMIYLEELNTILMNENFEVEVYEVIEDAIEEKYWSPQGMEAAASLQTRKKDALHSKSFPKEYGSFKGEAIPEEYFESKPIKEPTTNDVAYYFELRYDEGVNSLNACKGADIFNRDSYYIDLDFECNEKTMEAVYYDIYGPVTEPEICP